MTTSVTVVRRFYDALGRGDVPSVLSLLDDKVEWTEAERFPYFGGTWIGRQAVLDNLLEPLASDWANFSAQASEFITEGDSPVHDAHRQWMQAVRCELFEGLELD